MRFVPSPGIFNRRFRRWTQMPRPRIFDPWRAELRRGREDWENVSANPDHFNRRYRRWAQIPKPRIFDPWRAELRRGREGWEERPSLTQSFLTTDFADGRRFPSRRFSIPGGPRSPEAVSRTSNRKHFRSESDSGDLVPPGKKAWIQSQF